MNYSLLSMPEVVALTAPKPEIDAPLARLLAMLRYARPADSMAESLFIERFVRPFAGFEDAAGNLWAQVGERPDILWSSHTDTVHSRPALQKLFMRGSLVYSAGNDCLGADDTAGVWLMLEMIRAGVPGLYAFHRGEEIGGIGSGYVAKHTPERLDGIRFAVAFDRKGYDSVITHQGGRCCSDAFARSLAAILGGDYQPDASGLFTDTANYTGLVGECSNISVGYHGAHGSAECLDLAFVRALRDKLICADFSSLVFEREAGDCDDADWWLYDTDPNTGTRSYVGDYPAGGGERSYGRFGGGLYDIVYGNPLRIADWLEQQGYDANSFADEIGLELEAGELEPLAH